MCIRDRNIDPDLVLGLQRRVDGIDIVRVQEVGLRTVDDPTILQWAAVIGRPLEDRGIVDRAETYFLDADDVDAVDPTLKPQDEVGVDVPVSYTHLTLPTILRV